MKSSLRSIHSFISFGVRRRRAFGYDDGRFGCARHPSVYPRTRRPSSYPTDETTKTRRDSTSKGAKVDSGRGLEEDTRQIAFSKGLSTMGKQYEISLVCVTPMDLRGRLTDALFRPPTVITALTRSSSVKSRKTSPVTARLSSNTRAGPCSALPASSPSKSPVTATG